MRLRVPCPSSLRAAAMAGLALLAAACAGTPKPTVVTPAAPPPPPVSFTPAAPVVPARDRLRHALELLDAGGRDAARIEVTAALASEPDNALAKSLLRQIDEDPRQLFGAQSFSHRIAPGETLSSLAERFLGDRTLFYGLARYNGLDRPAAAEVGRLIQIPGTPPRPKAPTHRVEGVKPATPPATSAPPAPVAGPPRDPARAARLRAQALPLLAKGEVARAAALLREALRADPDNALVQRDLARAERIGARVR